MGEQKLTVRRGFWSVPFYFFIFRTSFCDLLPMALLSFPRYVQNSTIITGTWERYTMSFRNVLARSWSPFRAKHSSSSVFSVSFLLRRATCFFLPSMQSSGTACCMYVHPLNRGIFTPHIRSSLVVLLYLFHFFSILVCFSYVGILDPGRPSSTHHQPWPPSFPLPPLFLLQVTLVLNGPRTRHRQGVVYPGEGDWYYCSACP